MNKQSIASALKPIFLIGCPRSGTTILHQFMRLHPSVAWITPGTNLFYPHMKMAQILDKFLMRFKNNRFKRIIPPNIRRQLFPYSSLKIPYLPETSEGHLIWKKVIRKAKADGDSDYLTEKGATHDASAFFRKIVIDHLEYMNGERFLSKNPADSLRIRFINKIFPDAFFIHILRDGRAVANSLLNERKSAGNINKWWGAKPSNWRDLQKYEPILQVGLQWKSIVETIERDAKILHSKRYLVIKYEDFTEKPIPILKEIFEYVELDFSIVKKDIEKYAKNVRNMNWKWQKNLSEHEKEILNKYIGGKLEELGYY